MIYYLFQNFLLLIILGLFARKSLFCILNAFAFLCKKHLYAFVRYPIEALNRTVFDLLIARDHTVLDLLITRDHSVLDLLIAFNYL